MILFPLVIMLAIVVAGVGDLIVDLRSCNKSLHWSAISTGQIRRSGAMTTYTKALPDDSKLATLNYIKDLYPQAKNLSLRVVMLHVGVSYKTKDGNEVRSCKVADRSGSINLSIWGDYGNHVQPGDILSLSRCYAVLFKNSLTLYVGKFGSLTKVGEFCMLFSEVPDVSEPNAEWIQQNQDKIATSQSPNTPPSHHAPNNKSANIKNQAFRPK